MKPETNDIDFVIHQVLEQNQDLFDWVFENISEQEEVQSFESGSISDQDQYFIGNGNYVELENIKDKEESDSKSSVREVCEKTTQTDEPNNDQKEFDLKYNNRILVQKRPRGRPRKYEIKPKKKNVGQLWEFLLELLNSRETNPSFVRWMCRRKGLFKLVQPEKVAKMWGEKRTNPRMNYKKMSRTIRHYYKKNIMIPVFGKKLVYQFGPDVINYRINSK